MAIAALDAAGFRTPRAPAIAMTAPDPTPAAGAHADDVALARRAAARDAAAWRVIYQRTHERVFALLAYHVGSRDEALELTQEVYLHALEGLARYRGDGPLEAWFAIVAIRRARDWKRKLFRKRRHEVDDDELSRDFDASAPTGPDERAIPLRRLLDAALAKLPERQRAAFLLREVEDLSFRDVAAALGVNEATARVHHLRARRALQDQLAGIPGADEFRREP
jgi:RNA polymerase sigma-70 factor (ECF subfamily)